jgi:thiol-disulfide isomerase/thioredoxin
MNRWIVALLFACLVLPATAQQPERLPPVPPGQPFPAGVFNNLNAGETGPASIDLSQVLGKKPVVFYYWIAGNKRSEDVFLELKQLTAELPADRLAFFGVAVPRPGLGADQIRARLQALGITMPVLEDEGFRIGQRLQVSTVPNISVVDAGGILRLANGGSPRQVLGYQLDLAKAIRATAETGKLMTHGYLDPYFPARELEGLTAPDFKATQLSDNVERRWHSLLASDKVNVLIFWSVNCPHCRKSLPQISKWLEENPEGVNVVSCASVDDAATRAKTKEFCELSDFSFKTLYDEGSEIADLYKVTTTPTIVIIQPDGKVESVIVSGHTDFGTTIEQKKRELLRSEG